MNSAYQVFLLRQTVFKHIQIKSQIKHILLHIYNSERFLHIPYNCSRQSSSSEQYQPIALSPKLSSCMQMSPPIVKVTRIQNLWQEQHTKFLGQLFFEEKDCKGKKIVIRSNLHLIKELSTYSYSHTQLVQSKTNETPILQMLHIHKSAAYYHAISLFNFFATIIIFDEGALI